MKKKINKKRILILIMLLILILVGYFIFDLLKSNDEYKNTKIIAIKEITENAQTQKITYTIKIKDYLIETATKEIKFETKEQAQLEYNRYEIINKYERREIGLELKGKKLTLTMPETQLLQDIEFNTKRKIIVTESGEEIEFIDQQDLKDCLKNQGYTIK